MTSIEELKEFLKCEQCGADHADYKINYITDCDGNKYDPETDDSGEYEYLTERVCHQCYWYHVLEKHIDRLAGRLENDIHELRRRIRELEGKNKK